MRRLLPLALVTAGLLAAAPSALANTRVSLEHGTFGSGLSGDYVWVSDPTSFTDKRMDVRVARVGDEIKVTDVNGATNAHGAGCREQGASVFCVASGLEGLRIEGGDNNDALASDVNLPTVMIGDGGDDALTTGPANDQLDGQAGNDSERGGDGNDSFGFEKGDDTFNGGAGHDVLSYASAPSRVDVTLGSGANDGIAGEHDNAIAIEDATGSAFNDSLDGDFGPNRLRGGAGTDTLRGQAGDD